MKTRKKNIKWGKVAPLAAVILGILLFSVVFAVISYRILLGINVGGFLAYVVTDGGKYGLLFFILFVAVFVGMGIAIIDHNEKKQAKENAHLW